jgi:hypothetical protein
MLLPLQGDYITHLTSDRALPYPNAQALSGQKKIENQRKNAQLNIEKISTTIFKEIQTYYESN